MLQPVDNPPRGLFRGRNFMTPDVRGWYKLRQGEGWAELSSGTGIAGQPIFGVTVRPTIVPGRSQLFQSMAAALAYIASLS